MMVKTMNDKFILMFFERLFKCFLIVGLVYYCCIFFGIEEYLIIYHISNETFDIKLFFTGLIQLFFLFRLVNYLMLKKSLIFNWNP